MMLAAAAAKKKGNTCKASRARGHHPPISLRHREVPENVMSIARGNKKKGPPVKGLGKVAAQRWVHDLVEEELTPSAKRRLPEADRELLMESARKKIRQSFEPRSGAKPGRPPNVTDEQLLEITDQATIADALEHQDAITFEEFASRVEYQAILNRRPYKNKLTARDIENLIKRAAELQAAKRGVQLKVVGAHLTTEERQEGARNVAEAKEFFRRFFAAIKGIPRAILKSLLSWLDETPIPAEGDKSTLKKKALTTAECQQQRVLRKARALPHAREEGAKAHSLLVKGYAAKDMSRLHDGYFDLNVVAKGLFMQERWFARCEDKTFPLGVTEEEVNSVHTHMTPEGTMTASTWADVLEEHGKGLRARLAELGIDSAEAPYDFPLICVFDACTAHGVKKGTLELTDKACLAACEKYRITPVLLNHNTSASPVGGDPLDAPMSANAFMKYLRRQFVKAVDKAWSDPTTRVVLPDDDAFAEAQKKHKKLSFVAQVGNVKEWWETVEDAMSRCEGLDRGSSIRNTIMIALRALRSSPRLDRAWENALKDSGEWPPNDDVSALRPMSARGKEMKGRFVDARVREELPRAFREIADIICPFLEPPRRGAEPHSTDELQGAMKKVANVALSVETNPTCGRARRALQVFRSPTSKKLAAETDRNVSVSVDPETGREVRTPLELTEARRKAKDGPTVCKHKTCTCPRHCDGDKPHKTEKSQYCTSTARMTWLEAQGAKAKTMELAHAAATAAAASSS